MKLITRELIQELLTTSQNPCLSLYMTTHRSHPENLQDPVRFQNLVKKLESSLSQKYPADQVKELIAPFEAIRDDSEFWNHTLDGLAVFGAKGYFTTVGFQEPVDNLVIVADSFHTKPVRQYLQSADRYHVLGISLHDIRMFEGNRHGLTELVLPEDTPRTLTEALGEEVTDKHLTVASYGGGTGALRPGMHHGHGDKKDEVEIDAEKFFRVVSKEIHQKYSKPTGWPLILAALPEHHSLFHKVSKNPMLLSKGVEINPKSVSSDSLAELAWKIMEPEYLNKYSDLTERYQQEKANGKGSDDIREVAAAIVDGKVGTLIIEAGRIVEGRITNPVTGNVQNKDLNNPRIDDLLDDMGEWVTRLGGQVMVMPSGHMPSKTGVAAIYRY